MHGHDTPATIEAANFDGSQRQERRVRSKFQESVLGVNQMPRRYFVFAFVCALTASAQEYRSTITGHITDPSGSGVPSVKVVAIRPDTNVKTATVSSPEGFYTIPQLPPGTYDISVEASGFKSFVQRGI